MNKFLKQFAVLFLTAIIAVLVFNQFQEPTIINHEVIVEKNIGIALEQKIEQLKQELIDDIDRSETPNHNRDDLVIVLDPTNANKSKCKQTGGVRLYCYSIGNFQWQLVSLQEEYLKHYGMKLTDREAFEVANDYDQARELTYKVVFAESKGGIYRWLNTSKKIDAVKRIEFIRSLEE